VEFKFLSIQFWPLLLLVALVFATASKGLGSKKAKSYLALTFLRSMIVITLVISLMEPAIQSSGVSHKPRFFVGIDGSKSLERDALFKSLRSAENVLREAELKYAGQVSYFVIANQSKLARDFSMANEVLMGTEATQSPLVRQLEEMKSYLGASEYPVFLLFTDGNETNASASQLSLLSQDEVYVVPQQTATKDPLRIQDFYAPTKVLTNRKFKVQALLHSEVQGRVRCLWYRNDELIKDEFADFLPGKNYIEYEDQSEEVEVIRYRLLLEPDFEDHVSGSNQAVREVKVYQSKAVLLISSDQKGASLEGLLEDLSYKVRKITPDQLNPSMLSSFGAVLINDIPYKDIKPEVVQSLAGYVSRGGGFGMFGGLSSFGPGGYHRTEVEEILPLYMPPRSFKKSLAVMLLIDASGSMLSEDQSTWHNAQSLAQFLRNASKAQIPIEVAKDAAVSVIKEMIGIDVGVVAFNDRALLAVPLQKVSENSLPDMEKGVREIQAGGGTRFSPAISGAFVVAGSSSYSTIEFILLSDGSPSDKSLVPLEIRRLQEEKIRLHTIAFGASANHELLESMAVETGGRAYRSSNVGNLSQIFDKAIDEVFGPPLVLHRSVVELNPGQSLLERKTYPDILGYVSTSPKDRGEVVLTSDRGDPLLAVWQYGMGHSFAWTSDVEGRWSKEWLADSAFKETFHRVMAKIQHHDYEPYQTRVFVDGNQVTVLLSALTQDGIPIDTLEPEVRVRGDGRLLESRILKNLGEGDYRTQLIVKTAGDKSVEVVVPGKNEKGNWVKQIPVQIAFDLESSFSSPNEDFFELMKKARKIVYDSSSLSLDFFEKFRVQDKKITHSLSGILVGIALFLLFLDVIFRRFRVLDEVGQEGESTGKWDRMAFHYLQMAREASRRGDNDQAEKFYLSSHRYFKKAGDRSQVQKVWDEYRVKVR